MTSLTPARLALRSTVALKALMAVTGLIMIGYLLAHMYGNLKVFAGRPRSTTTRTTCAFSASPSCRAACAVGHPRVVLVSVLGHMYAAFKLVAPARPAAGSPATRQPGPDRGPANLRVVHPAVGRVGHRPVRALPPDAPDLEHRRARWAAPEPYDRVVNGFRIWWVVVVYTVAMVAVGFHLRHGTWSALTTLGANCPASPGAASTCWRTPCGRDWSPSVPASPVRDRVRAGESRPSPMSPSGRWPDAKRSREPRIAGACARDRRTASGLITPSTPTPTTSPGRTSPTPRPQLARSRSAGRSAGSPPSW